MKDTHRYVIETANLDTALKEFAQMNQGISINRTDNDNEIRLDITDGSRKGILQYLGVSASAQQGIELYIR